MNILLDRAYELASLLLPSRVSAIAVKMENLDKSAKNDQVLSSVTSGRARDTLVGFLMAWHKSSLSGVPAP